MFRNGHILVWKSAASWCFQKYTTDDRIYLYVRAAACPAAGMMELFYHVDNLHDLMRCAGTRNSLVCADKAAGALAHWLEVWVWLSISRSCAHVRNIQSSAGEPEGWRRTAHDSLTTRQKYVSVHAADARRLFSSALHLTISQCTFGLLFACLIAIHEGGRNYSCHPAWRTWFLIDLERNVNWYHSTRSQGLEVLDGSCVSPTQQYFYGSSK